MKTALARPRTGWLVRSVTNFGNVHTHSLSCQLCTLAQMRIVAGNVMTYGGVVAACIDNADGIHSDAEYGDIDVLRWAGLR